MFSNTNFNMLLAKQKKESNQSSPSSCATLILDGEVWAIKITLHFLLVILESVGLCLGIFLHLFHHLLYDSEQKVTLVLLPQSAPLSLSCNDEYWKQHSSLCSLHILGSIRRKKKHKQDSKLWLIYSSGIAFEVV